MIGVLPLPVALGLALSAGAASAPSPTLPQAQAPEAAAPDTAPPSEPLPLFQSPEPLAFTIEADFDQLDDDRSQESEERPARLVMTREDGTPFAVDMKVRTRGEFRLKRGICRMPNIRLNFPKGDVEGTVFHGQDKLKLVGYCRDSDRYEQNALQEHLAYRLYNALTPLSFQVRLARITYVDTAHPDDDPVVRWGFLIEDDDDMAARNAAQIIEVEQIHPARLQLRPLVLMSLFQFLIGNTDWSVVAFHNMEIVRLNEGGYAPVAFDFDFSGLVDAPYAEPAPTLNIRDVRQRLYRGFCFEGTDWPEIFAYFREKRPEMEEIVRTHPGFDDDTREDSLEWIEGFYELLDDEGRVQRRIVDDCRSMG